MEANEIYLNRKRINSLEVPRDPLQVGVGRPLTFRLINYGAPVHLSFSAVDAGQFTEFTHQNIFVRDEMIFDLPIREDAYPGTFSINVVTGYGTVRDTIEVSVIRPKVVKEVAERQRTQYPVYVEPETSTPPVVQIFAIVGLFLYLLWWYVRVDLLNFTAFVLLFAGILVQWYSHRQG